MMPHFCLVGCYAIMRSTLLHKQGRRATKIARSLTCDCGHVVTGKDDEEELVRLAREHINQVHPDMKNATDEQLRALVKQKAQDA